MMNSRRICPVDGLQYIDSAVGLVFMESAAGLAMESFCATITTTRVPNNSDLKPAYPNTIINSGTISTELKLGATSSTQLYPTLQAKQTSLTEVPFQVVQLVRSFWKFFIDAILSPPRLSPSDRVTSHRFPCVDFVDTSTLHVFVSALCVERGLIRSPPCSCDVMSASTPAGRGSWVFVWISRSISALSGAGIYPDFWSFVAGMHLLS
ncbi:hypothetical protein F511_08643 [Dorcoceras hygrometricum]|uniref:Uncharacterized protein n=1 Tax=Dorcoceras hygrometricum TaxID=472368 RepID=A0A2Z7APR8_9LAMI|nr:hypothetical protein F511_08643 [Dorcoceras hygrometricum]